MHFKTESAARRFAGVTNPVLVYKTGKLENGAKQVLIGVGHVTEPIVIKSRHNAGGTSFPYSVPFKMDFEFLPKDREFGIHLAEFEQLIGRKPHMLATGGLVPLSETEAKILSEELLRRYMSPRTA